MLRVRRSFAIGLVVIGATSTLAALPTPAIAFGSHGGTEVSTGTAPADGTLLTHTDEIPADATQASFGVQPTPGTDPHAFDEITTVLVEDFPWLAKTSKRSQAVLACAMLSYLPIVNKPMDQPITFSDVQLQVMVLNVCLRMALSIPSAPAARDRARSAATACGRLNPKVTLRLTHARGRYRGVVSSAIRAASRPRLTVSCRRSGKGLVLTIRPRKRGQALRKAAGPTLAIGYRNPSRKPVGIRTTFKVN
jgi:hypothetical protein